MKELKVGDHIMDNDPRMRRGRVLVICRIEAARVSAQDNMGRAFGIQRLRIHTDGKPRKSGFTLLAIESELQT